MKENIAVRHGGNVVEVAASLGCRVDEILDMSSNLSPLGMIPGLKEELIGRIDELNYLPESDSQGLRRAFAAAHDLDPAHILAGSGTTEFIFAAPECLAPHRAVIINPTYGDYRVACDRAGVPAVDFMLRPEDDFLLALERLGDFLKAGDLAFICNPNNPTAFFTPSRTLYEFVHDQPRVFFMVDESYIHFLDRKSLLDFLPWPENLLVLSSYSKVFGIPGIRLGFLVSSPDNLAPFTARGRPWGVNRMAQIAGEFVCRYGADYQAGVRRLVASERPRMETALAAVNGVEPVAGEVNFILNRLSGRMRAGELAEKMLARRIMVRDCENFAGLDDTFFRISLKTPEENDRFLQVLAETVAAYHKL